MADDASIMVDLGDPKAKEIAEVIGNKSCNRILEHLANSEGTVSDISRKLKMPINTVDYNVKKLVRAGLIEKSSHWWSVKGKKMLTYRVSNRKIIISPRKSVAKVFAWTLGLTGLMALTIRQLLGNSWRYSSSAIMESASVLVAEDAAFVNMKSKVAAGAGEAVGATFETAPVILEGAQNGGVGFIQFLSGISPWSWFLIGAWFAVFLFFAFSLYSERKTRGLS